MTTFVSVGNTTQPFTRLLQAVCDNIASLPGPVFIQFGTASNLIPDNCEGAAFVKMDEFFKRVAEADLVILHGGAGSVIHALRAGKLPVVMPRLAANGEHLDDHQLEFVRELESKGRVVVCHSSSELPMVAAEALHRQGAGIRDSSEPPKLLYIVQESLRQVLGPPPKESA